MTIAVSMGEPSGIGPEIILKSWRAMRSDTGNPVFCVFGDPQVFQDAAQAMQLSVPIKQIDDISASADIFQSAMPIIKVGQCAPISYGTPDTNNAEIVIDSIKRAALATMAKQTSALVTAPIHKAILNKAGFAHPGHTEFLGELAKAQPIMMLANSQLRCIPLSVHQSLRSVPDSITIEGIVKTAQIAHKYLRKYFQIENPRIAVCGLNPHAGENGQFGDEDQAIIAPAVALLQQQDIACTGPIAADSMFHADARATYDLALCMYHDQALIPIKTLDFHHSVNITIGLDFIRTSPDHGTALAIAGQGVADHTSMMSALRVAQKITLRVAQEITRA